ncbi:MAG TPA: glycosyltransferase, partial [Clostridia bacterium]|nr:glycosyltransferase [Clostridia bacterium]
DIECIIKAVKHIEDNNLNNGKEYKVHIVGDGINLENCKNLTKELDVVNQVVFHGRHPLSEMKRFYEMADCFLLTMRGGDFISMTLPGKAQSYLSVGKPIAGAIDGAAMEVINEADCGLCVRGSDHEGLASIMAQIMLDFETYKEKGHNGRKYYLDNFTKDSFFDSLFDIFVDLQESLR